ncbi:hypothetical protein [Paenibacillus fonticola]|uniref:hypothetical protein n=1 Tax=Paenibacillus fonticola TaxID=379896 RepID=UPI0003822FC7|nr:hypothetical protein [Paenibacillus fonticola]
MNSSSKSSIGRSILIWGGIGICIAIIAVVLNLIGVSIPVTIGSTEYAGWQSVGILAIGSPILLIIIGLIIAAFSKSK